MSTRELEKANRRLQALSETMCAFAEASTSYEHLVEVVTRRMSRLLGDGCALLLVSETGDSLQPASIFSEDEAAQVAAHVALMSLPMPIGSTGLASTVVATGRAMRIPIVVPGEVAHLFSHRSASTLAQLGLRSVLCVPLRAHSRVLGVLFVGRTGVLFPPFDEDDEALAQSLADFAALSISNAQLLSSLERELAVRKAAEEETRKFVSLVQNSSEFIAMAAFDGGILFVNDAGRKLLGIEADADVTKLTLADFHTDDGMNRREILLRHGRWEGQGQLRHQRTKELIPTLVSSSVVRGDDGQPLCFATVQHDVRATRRLEEHLRQVQKMEAIGRLAGGIAHDFNNLLAIILNCNQILRTSIEGDSQLRIELDDIETAAQGAATLTRQLLAFSRQQVLELGAVDFNKVVSEVAKMTKRLLGDGIELRVELDGDLGLVKADRTQLKQVILNLAVNARDAMHEGGNLRLETRNCWLDEAQALAEGLEPGPYVALEATDTGVGMDPTTASRVFDPFFTTKDVGKGTGLGLATVFGIVKQSAGQIAVSSALGKGTTFTVLLPRFESLEAGSESWSARHWPEADTTVDGSTPIASR